MREPGHQVCHCRRPGLQAPGRPGRDGPGGPGRGGRSTGWATHQLKPVQSALAVRQHATDTQLCSSGIREYCCILAGQEELSPEEVRLLVRREVTKATAPRVSREHIRLLKVRPAALQRP